MDKTLAQRIKYDADHYDEYRKRREQEARNDAAAMLTGKNAGYNTTMPTEVQPTVKPRMTTTMTGDKVADNVQKRMAKQINEPEQWIRSARMNMPETKAKPETAYDKYMKASSDERKKIDAYVDAKNKQSEHTRNRFADVDHKAIQTGLTELRDMGYTDDEIRDLVSKSKSMRRDAPAYDRAKERTETVSSMSKGRKSLMEQYNAAREEYEKQQYLIDNAKANGATMSDYAMIAAQQKMNDAYKALQNDGAEDIYKQAQFVKETNQLAKKQEETSKMAQAIMAMDTDEYSLASEYLAAKQEYDATMTGNDLNMSYGMPSGDTVAATEKLEKATNKLRALGWSDSKINQTAKYMQQNENIKEAYKLSTEYSGFVQDNPGIGWLTSTAYNALLAPVQGLAQIEQIADGAIHGNIDTTGGTFAISQIGQAGAAQVNENILNSGAGSAGVFVNDAFQSAMSSGMTAMLGGWAGEVVSLPMFGMSAFAQTFKEDYENGVDGATAALHGFFSGTFEMLFEKVSMDSLIETYSMANAGKVSAKDMLKRLALQSGNEGLEEVFTSIADEVAERAILGAMSTYEENVRMYMAGGWTERQARKKANMDTVKEIGMSFAEGALSGAMMTGPAMAMNARNFTKVAKNLNADAVASLHEAALQFEGTTAQDIAQGKSAEELTTSDVATIVESIADVAQGEQTTEEILAEELIKAGNTEEEARQNASDLVGMLEQGVREDDGNEEQTEQEKRNTEILERGSNAEVYGKLLTGELTEDAQKATRLTEAAYAAAGQNIEAKKALRKEISAAKGNSDLPLVTVKGTQNQIRLAEFDNLSGKNMMVRIYDGQKNARTIDLSKVDFADRESAIAYHSAASIFGEDVKAANAFLEMVNTYEGDRNVVNLSSVASVLYDIAKTGNIRFDDAVFLLERRGAIDQSFNQTDLRKIFAAGEEMRSIENTKEGIPQHQKTTGELEVQEGADERLVELLRNVAKKTTLNIAAGEKGDANGSFTPALGKIALYDGATNQYNALLHELFGEFVASYNPEAMEEIRSEILNYVLTEEGITTLHNHLKEYQRTYKQIEGSKTMEEAAQEYVNDFIANIFSTEQGIKDFIGWSISENGAEETRSLIDKIADFFQSLIDSIKDYMSGHKIANRNRAALEMEMNYAKDLRDRIMKAADQAIANYAEAEMQQVSERIEEAAKKVESLSVSVPIEQTDELIAVHNLTEAKLLKQLELEAFPMPSIAITKAALGWTNFGEYSYVFRKDTIDPKNKKNKVYAADAWTPTFPRVEYDADYAKAREIQEKLTELTEGIPEEFRRRVRSFINGLEYNLDNYGGIDGIIERTKDDVNMKAAYLASKGEEVHEYTTEKKETMADAEVGIAKALLARFEGIDLTELLKTNNREVFNQYGDEIRDTMIEYFAAQPGIDLETAESVVNNMKGIQLIGYLRKARDYSKNGGVKVTTEIDYARMNKEVNDRVDQTEYENWIKNLFEGVVKDSGIRNGKDVFTPSGTRRSFKQTHLPVTAQNIVKSMIAQAADIRNTDGFNGIKSIRAVAVDEFKSIAEIKKQAGKLQNIDDSLFEGAQKELSERLYAVIQQISEAKQLSDNPYIDHDIIGENILEAASKTTSPESIKKLLESYGRIVTIEQAQELNDIIAAVREMPVNMFEAKPLRTVDYSEGTLVMPNNASQEVRDKAAKWGIRTLEYEAGNDEDRKRVVNGIEGAKFSVDVKNMSDADMETEYLDLAENPEDNERKLQHMVDKAAKNWGAVTSKNGRPMELYHGTGEFGFTRYDMGRNTDSKGMIYATTRREVAANYAGREHYAGVRPIGKKYIPNTSTKNIIRNAESVLGQKFHVISNEERTKVISDLLERAKMVADKIDELYQYQEAIPELNNYEDDGLGNPYAWVTNLFFVVRDDLFWNGFDGYDEEEAQYKYNELEEALERYEDNWDKVRTYISENYSEIKNAGGKELADYLLKFELSDTAIDLTKMLRALSPEEMLISDKGTIVTPSKLAEIVDMNHNIGAYKLYGKLGERPLVIDAKGRDWLTVTWEALDTDYHSTDRIAREARERGYTSVVIKNVQDGGMTADDYIFFDQNAVKSADAITYDDDGNVIPLSERFNDQSDDIRYSIEVKLPKSVDEYTEEEKGLHTGGALPEIDYETGAAVFGVQDYKNQTEIKQRAKNIADQFGLPGTYTNKYNGERITLSKGSIEETVGRRGDINDEVRKKIKLAIVLNYAYFIENMVPQNRDVKNRYSKKGNRYDEYIINAKIDGKERTIKFFVKKTNQELIMHFARLEDTTVDIEEYKKRALLSSHPSLKGGSTSDNVLSQSNIQRNGKKGKKNHSIDVHFSSDVSLDEALEFDSDQQQMNSIISEGMSMIQQANLSEKAVRKVAREIIKAKGSAYKVDDLTKELMSVFSYIKESNVTGDDISRIMTEVARPIIEKTAKPNPQAEADYKAFMEFVKPMKIRLNSEMKKNVEYVKDSYEAFRKENLWRLSITDKGIDLDELWSQIVDHSYGKLEENIPAAEMPLALIDLMDELKPQPQVEGNIDEASYSLALEIFGRFFQEQAQETLDERVKTRMAGARERINAQNKAYRERLREQAKEKLKEEKAKLEEERRIARMDIAENLRNLDQMERERVNDLVAKEAIRIERERLKKKLERINQQKIDDIAEVRSKNDQRWRRAAETRKQTELKEKIRKNVDRLNGMLSHPTENAHVPVEMVKAVIDFCEAINVDSGKNAAVRDKLASLRDLYANYRGDQQFNFDYDEQTMRNIEELRRIFDKKSIYTLTTDELQRVYNMTQALRQQISNANKLIEGERKRNAADVAIGAIDDIRKARLAIPKAFLATDKYDNMHLNAERWFRKMSGWNDDSQMMSIYRELEAGQMRAISLQKDVSDMFAEVLEGRENQKNVRELVSTKHLVDVGLRDADGKPVLVTKAMRLSILMHIQNKQNLNHMIGDGLTIPDMRLYEQGKYEEAYEKGQTIQFVNHNRVLELLKSGDTETLEAERAAAADALRDLRKELSDYEKKFLAIAETFFHDYTGKRINEVSEKLKGYALARVKNYFPIKTDSDFTNTEFAGLVQNGSIEGMGFLKERVYFSRNPIMLEDITKVITRQTRNVSTYVGYAIPVRDINMVMNYTTWGSDGKHSIKEVMRRRWGTHNLNYLQNLMQDIQGGRRTEGSFFDTLRSNFAGATLTLNPSVAIKQAASFPTAIATLGYLPVTKALKDVPKGFMSKGIPELEKRNPLLWYRSQGYSSAELGDVKEKKNFGEAMPRSMRWIEFMDTGTVRTLEYASMYYVDMNMKNLKKGSEEYWNAVSDMFTKVVQQTQPNYTVLQQADIIRNPNKFIKQVVMFKTQPLQNYGIVYDALGEAMTHKDKKSAMKLFRAASSQIVAAAVFSGMTFLANLLMHKHYKYKDNDDDEYMSEDKIWEDFFKGIGSTMAGALIAGSEIYDYLSSKITGDKYYGFNVSTISTIDSMRDCVDQIYANVQKLDAVKTEERNEAWFNIKKNSEKALGYLGQIVGIPIGNMINIGKSIYLTAEDIANGDKWGTNYFEYSASNLPTQNKLIEQAASSGDLKEAEKLIREKAEAEGKELTDEDIQKEVMSSLKTEVKNDYLSGNLTETEAKKKLKKLYPDMDDTEVYKVVQQWGTGSMYGAYLDAIDKMISKGNTKTDELQKVAKEYEKNGYDLSKIKSALTKRYKPMYKNASKSEKATIKNILISAYRILGKSADDAKKDIEAWDKE